VDKSNEQTARIHRLQRERRTLAGLIAREERKDVLTLLENAQRLLVPVEVLNPFAPALRSQAGGRANRRDHEKYLTLIDSIALLHQHQRARGQHAVRGRVVEYIEVTLEDIALATRSRPRCWAARLMSFRRRLARCSITSAPWSKPGAAGRAQKSLPLLAAGKSRS